MVARLLIIFTLLILSCSSFNSPKPDQKNDSSIKNTSDSSENNTSFDYRTSILQSNVEPPIENQYRLDLDLDSTEDLIAINNQEVVVTLTGGTEQRFAFQSRIHDHHIITPSGLDNTYMILLATGIWEPYSGTTFVFKEKQSIIKISDGNAEKITLDLDIVGRGIDCHQFAEGHLCFYASYGDLKSNPMRGPSSIMHYDSRGTPTLANPENFPFPVIWPGHRVNGFHMIGATAQDYNGDGALDFLAVGQHSQILVGFGTPASTIQEFVAAPHAWEWIKNKDDYLSARSTKNAAFPCTYIAIETNESNDVDHILCYDAEEPDNFKRVNLPATYKSKYFKMIFKETTQGLEFYSRKLDGSWDLLLLAKN